MSGVLDLVREDLRGFGGYSSARSARLDGEIWLNANEAAWPNPGDAAATCRRYPEPQPQALRERLAALYGCTPGQLLIGRGSDEAIDLLVRALCVPGRDGVLYTPPVFGMYAVSARLQNAPALEVPLRDDEAGLVPDIDAIIATAKRGRARLVFLCSPSNPGGLSIPLAQVEQVAVALRGQALVVVDEAYAEFADEPSAATLLPRHDNIAVLRTLSKAHALAAARIGCVIADADLVAVLRCCQAPYPIPAPCSALALDGLDDAALLRTRERTALVRAERGRLRAALAALPGVRRVYASDANFLLVRFVDAETAFQRLLAAGVVVRDQRAAPQLHDALRITLGTPEQNARVLGVLATLEPAA
ncbi:histidinol-phosphate transaminase [Stenotrophomonas sp. PS02297]|uniref:histidinol-phosphate transaminase n=1 Tax=Stenotrophomonas sp. PS02297 TaxID=2991423 RepID=UPI00249B6EF4|nr:histidinol-phosphate transaminase [Stenotrophomonas sp. PS02297]